MEREHRHLDGEAEEECPEHPLLQANGEVEFHQLCNLERKTPELLVVLKIERQYAEQHQDRSGQRVQEKLDRGVELSRPAPHADDEIHGDEDHFPEHKKQKEIERHE